MRQLEAEADAIIQMVREGQRARRLQQAPPPAVPSASAAGSSVAAPHAPTGAAPPTGTAAAATVSMAALTAGIFLLNIAFYTTEEPLRKLKSPDTLCGSSILATVIMLINALK